MENEEGENYLYLGRGGCGAMISVIIPVKGADTFDMLKTRGYVSVLHRGLRFYHKFFNDEDFERWLKSGTVRCAWGETVLDLLKRGRIGRAKEVKTR